MNDTPASRIKAVIIDDNKRIRRLVKEILSLEEDIEVCGEAGSLQEAKAVLAEYQPDITISDLLFGEYRDEMFLREITKLSTITKVLILSAHSEALYSARCLQAGAKGYICKDKVVNSLAEAIRAVHAGKEFVSS